MQIVLIEKEKDYENLSEGIAGKIKRVLVFHKGSFYIVSENTALKETLVFPSSPTGEVESWNEVGGGRDLTLLDVLENFEKELFGYF